MRTDNPDSQSESRDESDHLSSRNQTVPRFAEQPFLRNRRRSRSPGNCALRRDVRREALGTTGLGGRRSFGFQISYPGRRYFLGRHRRWGPREPSTTDFGWLLRAERSPRSKEDGVVVVVTDLERKKQLRIQVDARPDRPDDLLPRGLRRHGSRGRDRGLQTAAEADVVGLDLEHA